MRLRPELCPVPSCGSLYSSPEPLADFKAATLLWGGREEKGRGREEERRRGARGRQGKEEIKGFWNRAVDWLRPVLSVFKMLIEMLIVRQWSCFSVLNNNKEMWLKDDEMCKRTCR